MTGVQTCALPIFDRWALLRLHECIERVTRAYDEFEFHLIFHRINQFFVVDLSAIYFDVLKDRLYTTGRNSLARRSAQTAMYHILESLVRWIAPVLSYTAEEIWELMPGERPDSVLMSEWYEGLFPLDAGVYDEAFWHATTGLINSVNEAIEPLRREKTIRGSLEASVHIQPRNENRREFLEKWGDELRFILIVSAAIVEDDQVAAPAGHYETPDYLVWIEKNSHPKCVRCWHQREDVGRSEEHPGLCGRCIENVAGAGEERRIA